MNLQTLRDNLNQANSIKASHSIRLSLYDKEVELDYINYKNGKCIFVGCEPVGPKPGKRLGISRPPEEE